MNIHSDRLIFDTVLSATDASCPNLIDQFTQQDGSQEFTEIVDSQYNKYLSMLKKSLIADLTSRTERMEEVLSQYEFQYANLMYTKS